MIEKWLMYPSRWPMIILLHSVIILNCQTLSANAFQTSLKPNIRIRSYQKNHSCKIAKRWHPDSLKQTKPSRTYFMTSRLFAKGQARFSGSQNKDRDETITNSLTTTSSIDSIFSFLSSDFGGVILGGLGLFLCLWNRISHLDYLDTMMMGTGEEAQATQLGQLARSDLLAVFATMAVFLNGVSKLDVTSALAESVDLEGIKLEEPHIFPDIDINNQQMKITKWALNSVLDATPANTAVLMLYSPVSDEENPSDWSPIGFAGIIPQIQNSNISNNLDILNKKVSIRTPILDRFMLDPIKQQQRKESYLPTLQALPGKVEFPYLPSNTQEALLLPISSSKMNTVLVLGSNTAKSFTPRDIAWCQVLTAQLDKALTS